MHAHRSLAVLPDIMRHDGRNQSQGWECRRLLAESGAIALLVQALDIELRAAVPVNDDSGPLHYASGVLPGASPFPGRSSTATSTCTSFLHARPGEGPPAGGASEHGQPAAPPGALAEADAAPPAPCELHAAAAQTQAEAAGTLQPNTEPSAGTAAAAPAPRHDAPAEINAAAMKLPLAAQDGSRAVPPACTPASAPAPASARRPEPAEPLTPLAGALLRALLAACARGGGAAAAAAAAGALPAAIAALARSPLRDPAARTALGLVRALLEPALGAAVGPGPHTDGQPGTAVSTAGASGADQLAACALHPAGMHEPSTPHAGVHEAGELMCSDADPCNELEAEPGQDAPVTDSDAFSTAGTGAGLAAALAALVCAALLHGGRPADAVLRNDALLVACRCAQRPGGARFCQRAPRVQCCRWPLPAALGPLPAALTSTPLHHNAYASEPYCDTSHTLYICRIDNVRNSGSLCTLLQSVCRTAPGSGPAGAAAGDIGSLIRDRVGTPMHALTVCAPQSCWRRACWSRCWPRRPGQSARSAQRRAHTRSRRLSSAPAPGTPPRISAPWRCACSPGACWARCSWRCPRARGARTRPAGRMSWPCGRPGAPTAATSALGENRERHTPHARAVGAAALRLTASEAAVCLASALRPPTRERQADGHAAAKPVFQMQTRRPAGRAARRQVLVLPAAQSGCPTPARPSRARAARPQLLPPPLGARERAARKQAPHARGGGLPLRRARCSAPPWPR